MNNKLYIAFVSGYLLTACTTEAEDPATIAQQYWDAIKNGNIEIAKQYVSIGSQQSFHDYLALPEERKVPVQEVHIGNQYATVTTIIHPTGEASEDYRSFDTVLVLEDGNWKVDADRSRPPVPKTPTDKELEELSDQLSQSMHENIETLDEAMTESMDMLNNLLREGSNEMGESLLKGMEELNRKMRESIDEMKQRRKKDSTIDEDEGEGMI